MLDPQADTYTLKSNTKCLNRYWAIARENLTICCMRGKEGAYMPVHPHDQISAVILSLSLSLLSLFLSGKNNISLNALRLHNTQVRGLICLPRTRTMSWVLDLTCNISNFNLLASLGR